MRAGRELGARRFSSLEGVCAGACHVVACFAWLGLVLFIGEYCLLLTGGSGGLGVGLSDRNLLLLERYCFFSTFQWSTD
jgi:hypothetical protein